MGYESFATATLEACGLQNYRMDISKEFSYKCNQIKQWGAALNGKSYAASQHGMVTLTLDGLPQARVISNPNDTMK